MSSMSSVYRQAASVFLIVLTGSLVYGQQAVDLPSLVEHIEQAALQNRAHYRPYVMTRVYRLYGAQDTKPKSEVKAEISFVPPSHQDYKILQADGNSHGESIVRHLLDDQGKAAATGRAPGAISRENYDFRYVGEARLDGSDCYVVQLLPKREEKSLIAGRAWIDKTTYLVRRIDGEMSKMPSWWLKSVHVTLDFGSFDGMWLQQGTTAVADVRIVGVHTFTSKAIGLESGGVDAFKMHPAPGRRSRGNAILGAVIEH
jgi:hypothetical protein